MTDYGMAQGALLAGLAVNITGFVTTAYQGLAGFVSAAATSEDNSIESLLPQLGIFTIVIVVFKFMLGRQDARDASAESKDKQTLEQLRRDMDSIRKEHAEERAAHAKELADERAAHDATRQRLIALLMKDFNNQL